MKEQLGKEKVWQTTSGKSKSFYDILLFSKHIMHYLGEMSIMVLNTNRMLMSPKFLPLAPASC